MATQHSVQVRTFGFRGRAPPSVVPAPCRRFWRFQHDTSRSEYKVVPLAPNKPARRVRVSVMLLPLRVPRDDVCTTAPLSPYLSESLMPSSRLTYTVHRRSGGKSGAARAYSPDDALRSITPTHPHPSPIPPTAPPRRAPVRASHRRRRRCRRRISTRRA